MASSSNIISNISYDAYIIHQEKPPVNEWTVNKSWWFHAHDDEVFERGKRSRHFLYLIKYKQRIIRINLSAGIQLIPIIRRSIHRHTSIEWYKYSITRGYNEIKNGLRLIFQFSSVDFLTGLRYNIKKSFVVDCLATIQETTTSSAYHVNPVDKHYSSFLFA